MIRSMTKDITVGATTLGTVDFLTGKPDVPRYLIGLWFEAVAGVDPVGFLDQDQVLHVGEESAQAASLAVPIEGELPEGRTFKLGWDNTTGGAITQKITLFYREG